MEGSEEPRKDRVGLSRIVWGAVTASLTGAVLTYLDFHCANARSLYGEGLFVLTPLISGFVGGLVAGTKITPHIKDLLMLSVYAMLFSAILLLVSAAEGAVCLVMAAPLLIPVFMIGAVLSAWALGAARSRRDNRILCSLTVLAPIAFVAAIRSLPPSVIESETSTIIIRAPAARVWPLLFRVGDLPAPSESLFRTGVAYPLGTRSAGTGTGDARYCILSTGTMPERISFSDPGHELRFSVLQSPPCMKESNPFGDVQAAHLNGYFTCLQGGFRITELPGGVTRLDGFSIYRLRLYPTIYWRLWTQSIVDQVHLRVMRQIRKLAESPRR